MIVRTATERDAEALAVVHIRSWQEAYRGKVPQDYLDQLDPTQRRQGWRDWIREDRPPAGTLVLVHDTDGVIGLVNVSPSRDPDTDPDLVGEIQALYLLPEHWGRGAGRLLMAAGVRRLANAGYRELVLWVLETNDRARRFYEADGWRADGSRKTDDSRGFPYVEVRYRRRVIPTVEPLRAGAEPMKRLSQPG
ncbi:GNAT family N-acetyltransferase [Micromonospora siamensis]|uniref:Ribosomal protein S18 acetylase RimI n=1 Tax=Micromonospora siamensis TaxID=299152 RepID=A0A1C5HPC1_9ACTN|nr:GNAT family N-acetyltransferase [Micromonospora siamensis]SCG47842.1 Ribosomal protein S18 acetylase RimI [Micromonospora siamensis]